MQDKNLEAALRLLAKALADPTHSPVQLHRLRIARRELERQKQAGKLDQRAVFRAVALIAEVLHEERMQKRDEQMDA